MDRCRCCTGRSFPTKSSDHALAAGFFAALISALAAGADLRGAVERARGELRQWEHHDECLAAVDAALRMVESVPATPESVERLGQGWVAEEALAIALFCALTARDFATGVSLAVTHSGDSDSTGALTGNILGLLHGQEAIPPRWLEGLELREVIEETAVALYGCAAGGAPGRA